MGLFLLTPSGASATPELVFSAFVITAEKFQTILWREFLIEFPNIYAKRNHRIFKTGTVVFYDSDQSPTLLFFANQKIKKRKDGLVSRITRLNMRSPSGREFIDILVSDVGKDLEKTPLAQLLMGELPLDLEESMLQEKNVSVSSEETGDVEMRFLIRSEQAGEADIILNVVRENRNLFRIGETRKNNSREVTWFLDSEKAFNSSHTLRVKKIKTDWMLFGSEEFYLDGLESTPDAFQSNFSEFGVQRLIVDFQKQMKEAIESAICHPDCDENDSGREKDDAYN